MLLKRTILLATLLIITIVTGAYAQPVAVSDTMTIFIPGVGPAAVTITETDEPGVVGLSPTGGDSGPVGVFPDESMIGRATALLEADGSISDVFGVIEASFGGGQTITVLAWASDSENQAADTFSFGTPEFFFLEGPQAFDATMYLAPSLRDAGWTATFQSDFEAVPEPASIALLGCGLVGLAAWRQRRK